MAETTPIIHFTFTLQDRGDEAEERFEEALAEGAFAPFHEGQFAAFLQVFEEDVAHTAVERGVVYQKVALEVVFEAAEVEIR